MNSDQIHALLETIAAQSSSTDKIEALRAQASDETLRRILRAALDPFTTYGTLADSVETCGTACFSDRTYSLLDKLATRQLTGNAAKTAIQTELATLSLPSATLLERILAKDLRCGIGVTTANKAIPELIPTFSVMLAHPYEARRTRFPAIMQPKLDGVRVAAVVNVDAGSVLMLSRNGKPFTSLDKLSNSVLQAVQSAFQSGVWILDGEVTSGTFNETVSSARKKSVQCDDALFHVFDLLPGEQFFGNAFVEPYVERMRKLDTLLEKADSLLLRLPHLIVNDHETILSQYQQYRDEGFEGAMVKPVTHLYTRKRSHDWQKLKGEETVDVEVVGKVEGTGKYLGSLGALIVRLPSGVLCNVGSGLTDAQRSDFHTASLNGRIVEVEFHEYTPDGNLRHPRFVKFRDTLEEGLKE